MSEPSSPKPKSRSSSRDKVEKMMEKVKSFTENKKVGQIASDTDAKMKQDAKNNDNRIHGVITTGHDSIHKAMALTNADDLVSLTTLPDGNPFSRKHHGDIIALQQDEDGANYLYRDGKQTKMSKESFLRLRQELEEIDTRSFPSIRTTKCLDCHRMIPDGIEHFCENTNVYTEVGPQQVQPTAPLMPVQNINMATVKHKIREQDKKFTTSSRDPNRRFIQNESKTNEDPQNMNLLLETVIGLNKNMTLMQAKMEKMAKNRQRRNSSSSSSDSSSSSSKKKKHKRHSRPVLKKTSQYDMNDIDFGDYLSRSGNKERLRNIPQLVHSQGATYSKWLSVVRKQMQQLSIPEHLFLPIAINKVPDDIQVRVLSENVENEDELEDLLHTIYCGASNSTNLKRNFKKKNTLSPLDRNYDGLRNAIMTEQVPVIISVDRIGRNRKPEVREALIEQASFTIGRELFLDALQADAKRSVLNKGHYDTLDELVQRANDFASSTQDDNQKQFIGGIMENKGKTLCKIHPKGTHTQEMCRFKCKLHPWAAHTDRDCNRKNDQTEAKTAFTCPPERAGIHGHTMWCLYCNSVTPKMEDHRCTHCWKHSTKNEPVYTKDCQCPFKGNKQK